MDWFMVAFVLILVGFGLYYLTRQVNDPGNKVFPFNSVGEFASPSFEANGSNDNPA
ncbi:MAG: hypothetical protein WDA53_09410 [Bacillota bacterium]